MNRYKKFPKDAKVRFIDLIDRMLRKKNDYISSCEIIRKYEEETKIKVSPKVSECGPLKAAKREIRKCLAKKSMDFEIKKGTDRRMELFKYPENVPDDLLNSLKKETKRLRLKTLDGFIQKTTGLFPDSWLAKFTPQAEGEIGKSGASPVIGFDANEQLWNLELLPIFYYAIRDKQVLKFTYAPYGKPERVLTFHPHYLKEYNLRWFVFGLAINDEDQYVSNNCALDRIKCEIEKVKGEKYIPATVDYSKYFDDIVGVTLLKGKRKEKIEIEVKDYYTYMRILTKQLHKSQKIVRPWNSQTRKGRFSIDVIPNPELLGLLMSFEGHIEIFGEYRKKIMGEVNKMYNLYKTK